MTSVEVRPRSPGVSYQQLLDTDSNEVPEILRREQPLDDGPMFVPVERYISPDFFQLERAKVWDRTWQMACREEHLPNVGDYIVYDVAGRSYLVVRSGPSTIQAFHNVCLHRGRLLRTEGGCRATEFRCPFHGFGWKIDGSLARTSRARGTSRRSTTRPTGACASVQVGTWGGFVFINPDPAAPSLADVRRRARRPLRPLAARGPLRPGPRRQGAALQLEGRPGGVHGGDARRRHPSPDPAEHRRRQLAVRRVRQLQPGDHRQRHAEPAPQVGADRAGDARLDVRPQPRRAAGAHRAGGAHRPPGRRRQPPQPAAAGARRRRRHAVRRRGQRQLLLHAVPQLPPVGGVQPHRLPVPAATA